MAWIADNRDGHDLVVRAGAGVFFGTDNVAGSEAFDALGFSATNYLQTVPGPVAPGQFDFSTAVTASYTKSAVYAFPRHFQLPYSIQWNVALEKVLGRS
jgi:hypothetical protein